MGRAMDREEDVKEHYRHDNLLAAISDGLEKLGKSPKTVKIDDLAPVDEFHIGGRQASIQFLSQLGLSLENHVLDIGSGLGGTARFIAKTYRPKVTGIDLTPEFVETGRVLNDWVGLSKQIELLQGSATALPFDDETFDAAVMLHVGMNIADKPSLFAEVFRSLRPGGVFGIYDVMKTSDKPLDYPVPWASVPETSSLAEPEAYRVALLNAGFDMRQERNRLDFAQDSLAKMIEKTKSAGGPPPLGLHILFGDTAATKIRNMVAGLAAGKIAPVEMIARKPR